METPEHRDPQQDVEGENPSVNVSITNGPNPNPNPNMAVSASGVSGGGGGGDDGAYDGRDDINHPRNGNRDNRDNRDNRLPNTGCEICRLPFISCCNISDANEKCPSEPVCPDCGNLFFCAVHADEY